MLVPDFAHELLQDILHRHDAHGAAVFVGHHGHLRLRALKQAQSIADLGTLRHIDGLFHDGGQVKVAALARAVVKIFLVDDAHDVIQRLLVDGQARIARRFELVGRLLLGAPQRDAVHPHARGEDVADVQVVKLDGAFEQFALVGVHAALLLGFLHQGEQLVLGDGVVVVHAQQTAQKLLPLGKEPVDRLEHRHKYPNHRIHRHGEALRHLLGQALGRDLTEDEHKHGHNGRGHAHARAAQPAHEHHRAHRGQSDVDDVVAYQNGGEQLVIAFS